MGSPSSPHSPDLPNDKALPSLSSTHPINGINSLKSGDSANPEPTVKQLRHNPVVADRRATEAAVRAAKAEIRSKLREDWAWPSATETTMVRLQDFDGASWRERESDEEVCPHEQMTDEADPYLYDNPDAATRVGTGRKRKRRELLRDEMEWNDGLEHFMQRRDAWTGAMAHQNTRGPSQLSSQQSCTNCATSQSFPLPLPSGPSPPLPQPTIMIPIAPSIIPPDNAIRASITPPTYPSLYSKIVIQGLTPTVPINLSDMVQALVQGWKRDGEWPPKNEAEKNGHVNGHTKGSGRRLARRSVGRVKRVLGIGNAEEGDCYGEGL